MKLQSIVAAGLLLLGACGEDKGYGDPIDDPNATTSAEAAVGNATLLGSDQQSNDAALGVINTLSANMNLLAGAKLQQQQGAQQYALPAGSNVDEACVTITDTTITYDSCDYAGNTVDGTFSHANGHIDIDLVFHYEDVDLTTDVEVDSSLDVSDAALTGFLDFKVNLATDGVRVTSRLDGDFDIVLSDGCAVDGDLEVHASASANGQSQDVWVKAEYGPSCGDIVIR